MGNKCESCGKDLEIEKTYVVTLEFPEGGVITKDLCKDCFDPIHSRLFQVLQNKGDI